MGTLTIPEGEVKVISSWSTMFALTDKNNL